MDSINVMHANTNANHELEWANMSSKYPLLSKVLTQNSDLQVRLKSLAHKFDSKFDSKFLTQNLSDMESVTVVL